MPWMGKILAAPPRLPKLRRSTWQKGARKRQPNPCISLHLLRRGLALLELLSADFSVFVLVCPKLGRLRVERAIVIGVWRTREEEK